jgi:hypothetical protein
VMEHAIPGYPSDCGKRKPPQRAAGALQAGKRPDQDSK